MKRFCFIVILLSSIILSSCSSTEQTDTKPSQTNITSSEKKDSENSTSKTTTVSLPVLLALKDYDDNLLTILDSTQTINGIVVYDCKDYVNPKEILFQVGYFEIIGSLSKKKETFGFIIFQEPFLKEVYWKVGTPMPGDIKSESDIPPGRIVSPAGIAPEAIAIMVRQEGLNYSWSWYNPQIENSSYTIILKPDGTILYYDFTNVPYGESAKPSSVLKSYKHIVKGNSLPDFDTPVLVQ